MTKIINGTTTTSNGTSIESDCNNTTTKSDFNAAILLASLSTVSKHDKLQSDLESLNLRPKFASLKPKTEASNNNKTNKPITAPAWFFNIPTNRSPFPDMSSSNSDETGAE